MSDIPLMYVVTCDGDMSDADYLGVSKSLTATGSQYRITGPLAKAWASALMAERKKALDEAAKVAEERADAYAQIASEHEGTPIGESNTMRCGAAAAIADAIRKLGEGR